MFDSATLPSSLQRQLLYHPSLHLLRQAVDVLSDARAED
jgi:hypothetical protein